MSLLFYISLFLLFYAYFGYPILLTYCAYFSKKNKHHCHDDSLDEPTISIVITVRNEENVIREKIENTLALPYFGQNEKVQIIVASDASDDSTDSIVAEFANRDVLLVRSEERLGKETAQKKAIEHATGEIIIFSDAKIELDKKSLENFVQYFKDPSIGAVSSLDKIKGGAFAGSGEGLYVQYEMWLRLLESKCSSVVGLSGSCFAVRKEHAQNLDTSIPSDFSLLLATIANKQKGIQANDVLAYYAPVANEEDEFERKIRTVLRGITTFFK